MGEEIMRLYKYIIMFVFFVVVAVSQVGCSFFKEPVGSIKEDVAETVATLKELPPLQEGENFIVVSIGGAFPGTRRVFIVFNKGRYIELFSQDSVGIREWKKAQEYEEYIANRVKNNIGIKYFKERKISAEEINYYRNVVEDAKLYNWKDEYKKEMTDGTQWSISITLAGKYNRFIYGSNAFPNEWKNFIKYFSFLKS